eukprot:COSAG02_NODE_38691_length_426_cov_0.758410_1_plen_96_part_01
MECSGRPPAKLEGQSASRSTGASVRAGAERLSSLPQPAMPSAALSFAPIFAALVPITVLQLVLIHIDHEVPPRCVNLLDINISAHAPRIHIPLRAG